MRLGTGRYRREWYGNSSAQNRLRASVLVPTSRIHHLERVGPHKRHHGEPPFPGGARSACAAGGDSGAAPGTRILSQAIFAARRPHRLAGPREPCRIHPLYAIGVGDNGQAPAHRRRRPVAAGQVPHPHAAASLPDQPSQNFTVHRYPLEPPRQLDIEGVEVDVAHALEELGGPGVGQGLFGIRPVTFYRYVGPQGELREQGQKVLAS